MTHRISGLVLLAAGLFLFSGCLGWQRADYLLEVDAEGRVRGQVTFFDLVSDQEDAAEDYRELVEEFIQGGETVVDWPLEAEVRELFECEGRLCGVIRFELADLRQAGFQRDPVDPRAAWLLPWEDGTPSQANGRWLEPDFDLEALRWPAGTTRFEWTIPGEADPHREQLYSLLPYFLAERAQ